MAITTVYTYECSVELQNILNLQTIQKMIQLLMLNWLH